MKGCTQGFGPFKKDRKQRDRPRFSQRAGVPSGPQRLMAGPKTIHNKTVGHFTTAEMRALNER